MSAETSTKLDIDGISKPYEVFKIKLDLLYYNDHNDRIATWISQYKSENGELDIEGDRESYNDIIHDFIFRSNPQAMSKTMNNIKAVGQRVPGVVLRDGRIIDGNRRFSCLRTLSEEDPSFNYFEAVILDHDYTRNEKTIKALELRLQHGADKPVDYNPIDRLVGIYNNLIKDEMFTADEYAKYTDTKKSAVVKNIELAKLLVEFLQFINAPLQFHLARTLDIDGPLHEIYAALTKISDDDEKDLIKRSMFSNLLMHPSGDMTRYIRKIKNVLTDPEISVSFLEEQEDYASELVEIISNVGHIDQKVISEEIQKNDELKNKLDKSLERALKEYSFKENKNEPVKLISNAKEMMDGIDDTVLKMIDPSKVDEVKEALDSIEARVQELRAAL